MSKKYLVNPGYSQTTIKGIAHAGAVVSADLLTIEDAGKYLEGMVKKGKFSIVEEAEPVEAVKKEAFGIKKKENTDPILTDSQRKKIAEEDANADEEAKAKAEEDAKADEEAKAKAEEDAKGNKGKKNIFGNK